MKKTMEENCTPLLVATCPKSKRTSEPIISITIPIPLVKIQISKLEKEF
jgi:hypothetical protein